jgi:hypothetical protein
VISILGECMRFYASLFVTLLIVIAGICSPKAALAAGATIEEGSFEELSPYEESTTDACPDKTFVTRRTRSKPTDCTYSGYCMGLSSSACGFDYLSGKYKCFDYSAKMSYRSNCKGSLTVTYETVICKDSKGDQTTSPEREISRTACR